MDMTMTNLEKNQSFIRRLSADHAKFMDDLDRSEHRFNIFMGVVIAGMIIIFIVAMALAIWAESTTRTWYEYVDIDGNKGTADSCFEHRAYITCDAGNKTVQVKEYEKFSEPR